MLARRADLVIDYQGIDITEDLKPYLTQFSYSDGEGQADDININLMDREGKWHGPWLPGKHDVIKASIVTKNWRKNGEEKVLNCGTFFVDDVSFKGPPDAITIKALSIKTSEGGKGTKRSRGWENTTLATVASDISASLGLTLLYDAHNPFYDRLDQSRESDLSFIKKQARSEGIAVKVTKSMLVLYEEKKYEDKKVVRKYEKGDWFIKSYSFEETAADEQYKKVIIKYFDDTKKKVLSYTFNVPDIEKGPTLTLNKRAKNIGEAQRLAKAAAREKNKGAKKGKMTLVGDVDAVQGITVEVKGFQKFDGKYIIESSKHDVTGGYQTSIDLREVLGY